MKADPRLRNVPIIMTLAHRQKHAARARVAARYLQPYQSTIAAHVSNCWEERAMTGRDGCSCLPVLSRPAID